MTVGSDGLPVVAFYDRTETVAALKVAHCADVACTSITDTDTATIGGQAATLDSGPDGSVAFNNASIAIGSDGFPLVSYYAVATGDLKVAHCANVLCTASSVTTLDGSTSDAGMFTSVAIGTDGLGVIGYYEQVNGGRLKFAHCANVTCSSADAIRIVDDEGTDATAGADNDDVGKYTSLAIGADGIPVMSYQDSSAQILLVARCTDVTCTGRTLAVLNTTAAAVLGTSIAIGIDGIPVVAFYAGDGMRMVRCTDRTCQIGLGSVLVDAMNSATLGANVRTSVSIGSDGLPVVAYAGPSSLRVAKCTDVGCVGAIVNVAQAGSDIGDRASMTIGTDGMPLITHTDRGTGALHAVHCSSTFCAPHQRAR